MSIQPKQLILRSRDAAVLGDFPRAIAILHESAQFQPHTDDPRLITLEKVRLALIQANHIYISTLTEDDSMPDDVDSDLLRLCLAMNRMWTELDFVGPMKLASSMYHKYLHGLAMKDADELVELRILYYCTVIHDWYRLYGDSLPHLEYQWDQNFLQTLISKLAEQQLYFEMIDVLEFLVEDPRELLQTFATHLISIKDPGFRWFLLCLARVNCVDKDYEQADKNLQQLASLGPRAKIQPEKSGRRSLFRRTEKGHVSSKDQLGVVRQGGLISFHETIIRLRFLDTTATPTDRIKRLIQVSTQLTELGEHLAAFKALEYSAELLNLIPDLSKSSVLGAEIHRLLDENCDRNADFLSKMLIEFRHCDLLNSGGGNFALARKRRQDLLDMPICRKLPYFQKYHQRQWAEYYMLQQREPALVHAEKYLAFRKACKSGEELSRAHCLVFETLLLPERGSDETQLTLLEDLKQSVKQSVENDTANSFHRAMFEKQLLLVNIIWRIAQLEDEEAEDTVLEEIEKVLTSTDAVVLELKNDTDYEALRCQVTFLRASLALHLESETSKADNQSLSAIHERHPTIDESDHLDKVDAQSYLQPALMAIMTGSLSRFKTTYDSLLLLLSRLPVKGNNIRRVSALTTKAEICYFLLQCNQDTAQHFWAIAGFSDCKALAEEALGCFEQVTDLRIDISRETKEHESQVELIRELELLQAYHTSSTRVQQNFDMSIEIAHGLGDTLRTWQWIQRGKARSLTQILKDSISPLPTGSINLFADRMPTFDSLCYMQSASATQLVFVDWINVGISQKKLLISLCRVMRGDCKVIQLYLDIDQLELSNAASRINEARMNDHNAQRYLQPFAAIIKPLEEFSKPGDILILSPTSPFQNVPLHAITLGSQILIERNPVIYVPSHLALLSCLERLAAPGESLRAPTQWKAVVAAAYEDDSSTSSTAAERSRIYQSATNLAFGLGAELLTGPQCTVDNAKKAAESADLLHIHSHAVTSTHDPKNQHLALHNNQPLTIPNIAALHLNNAHVSIIACSGGVQDFSLALDEPYGILSAFMLGGAASAIGAL